MERNLGALPLSPLVRHNLRGLFAVERTFLLTAAGDAIRHLHEGRARGKVVLVP